MPQPLIRKIILPVAAAVLLLALGGAIAAWFAHRTEQPTQPADGEQPKQTEPRGPIRFREQAHASGIAFHMDFLSAEQGEKFKANLYDHGCGVVIGDYDGDGHDDVYFLNQLGPNALYRNKGDGTFEEVAAKAGVALGDRVCVGAVFADYDNDGHLDLYVTSTRGGNVLFHNNGRDGTFTDVTKTAGVGHVGHSQTAAFFDYDNDGYLDLFVTNTAKWTLNDYDKAGHYYPGLRDFIELISSTPEHNLLYRNNGNGTFTDVTAKVGLKGKGWGGDVAVFDFNDDGRLDLLVTNMFGASQLYRNDGGTFTDVTRDILGRTSWGAIGCKAFDYNNDGRLDLLIVDMHSDMWLDYRMDPRKYSREKLSRKEAHITGPFYYTPAGAKNEQHFLEMFPFRYEDVLFGNTLFKKLASGKFEEVSDQAGMETFWPWGVAIGDFDSDGFEDVYLPSGMGYPYPYWPSALMRNNGDGTFSDHATDSGIEPLPGGLFLEEKIDGKQAARSSRCAAVADLDGDGRLDVLVNNFNDRAFYYHNDSPRRNYIAFRLTGDGQKSNRDAVGALVTLHAGADVMVRQVQAAGGYLSQSSRLLHFGLGARDKVDYAEVRWPSGRRERVDAPAINTLHVLTEGRR
jgi:hypothetical protein